jgi:hypothetical protein
MNKGPCPDDSRGAGTLVCLARCERLRDSGRPVSLPQGFANNPGLRNFDRRQGNSEHLAGIMTRNLILLLAFIPCIGTSICGCGGAESVEPTPIEMSEPGPDPSQEPELPEEGP